MSGAAKDRPGVYPWERRDDETPAAWRGFRHYLEEVRDDLKPRDRRSLERTAAALNHSNKRTVEEWSRKYSWVARVEAYDDHILAERGQHIIAARVALAVEQEEARIAVRRRRLAALLGDPDANPDLLRPSQRGLVGGLLSIIDDPSIKGGPRVNAWKLLEERSGIGDDPPDIEDDNNAALAEALRELTRFIEDDEAPLFFGILKRAIARRDATQADDGHGGDGREG